MSACGLHIHTFLVLLYTVQYTYNNALLLLKKKKMLWHLHTKGLHLITHNQRAVIFSVSWAYGTALCMTPNATHATLKRKEQDLRNIQADKTPTHPYNISWRKICSTLITRRNGDGHFIYGWSWVWGRLHTLRVTWVWRVPAYWKGECGSYRALATSTHLHKFPWQVYYLESVMVWHVEPCNVTCTSFSPSCHKWALGSLIPTQKQLLPSYESKDDAISVSLPKIR